VPFLIEIACKVGQAIRDASSDMADDGRRAAQGLAAREIRQTRGSQARKHEEGEEYADDADRAGHPVLEDNDVGDEEWNAICQEKAAGRHCPSTSRRAALLDGPPCDAVDDGENGRKKHNQLAHEDENDANEVGMEIRSGVWEGSPDQSG